MAWEVPVISVSPTHVFCARSSQARGVRLPVLDREQLKTIWDVIVNCSFAVYEEKHATLMPKQCRGDLQADLTWALTKRSFSRKSEGAVSACHILTLSSNTQAKPRRDAGYIVCRKLQYSVGVTFFGFTYKVEHMMCTSNRLQYINRMVSMHKNL